MTKIKLFFITICITLIPSLLYSQTTIFSENCGNPTLTTTCTSYTGWQNNSSLTFSASATGPDVRTTLSSSGYAGASGNGNIFFINGVSNRFIQISGINTSNYTSLSLSFGILKTTNASTGSELVVEVSINGNTYTSLSYTLATGSGTSNVYYLKTPTGTIPSTGNLRIRFRYTSSSSTCQFRIDDIKLTGLEKVALPLTMGSFNIQKSKIGCILVWETYNEKNVDKFVIMKSTDGYEWKGIKELKARGNTTFKELYTFVDTEVSSLNYYQLFIYDNDGAYIKSKVVGINNKTELILPKKLYNILGQEILYGEQYGIPGQ